MQEPLLVQHGQSADAWRGLFHQHLLAPPIPLEGLTGIDELTPKERVQRGIEAIREAIVKSGGELEKLSSHVFTNSFPGKRFISSDGKLEFSGFPRLLEFVLGNVQEELRPFSSVLRPSSERRKAVVWAINGPGAVIQLAERNLESAIDYVPSQDLPHYHIESLKKFRFDLPPEELLKDLQQVFREIVQHQFEGKIHDYDLKEGAFVCSTRYGAPGNQETISGSFLVDLYARTLAIVDPSFRYTSGGGLEEANQRGRVMRHVRDHAFTEQLTRAEQLSLFAAFDFDPVRIFEAWAVVHNSGTSWREREKFLSRYPGLTEENPADYYEQLYGKTPPVKSPRRFLIELMLRGEKEQAAEVAEGSPRLSSLTERVTRLFLSLARKEIQVSGREHVAQQFENDARELGSLPTAYRFGEKVHVLSNAALRAAELVRTPLTFQPVNLRLTLQEYQREGAAFLLSHERAILGDAFSLGKTLQAIAALEVAGVKRVLWITPASNRLNIHDEILKSINIEQEGVFVIPPPSEWGDTPPTLPASAKYLILSYDTLRAIRARARTSEEWNTLYQELRVGNPEEKGLVIDEAQFIDNPAALRSKEVRALQSKYAFLLTATPFQNRIDSMFDLLSFVDPTRFSDRSSFRKDFLSSDEGFQNLLELLPRYFLGREQSEVALPFEDFRRVSLEEQFSLGLPRFAKRELKVGAAFDKVVVPDGLGELYLEMLQDFRGWARNYNENLSTYDPERFPAIPLPQNLTLQKFTTLMRVLYEPHLFGGEEPEYLYHGAAALVREYLSQGEQSVICFGESLSLLHGVQRSLGGGEAAVFSGELSERARSALRAEFESGNVNTLLIQARAGGLGLSFRRADAVIFLQPMQSTSQFAQAHGRAPRNVYPGEQDTPGISKSLIPYHYLVPVLSSALVDGVPNQRLQRVLQERGTLPAVAIERLLRSNRIYEALRAGGQRADDGAVSRLFQGLMEQAGIDIQ